MNSISGRHWGYRVLFYTRIVWIAIHLFIIGFIYFDEGNGNILIASGVIAGLIPQLVWWKGTRLPAWVYPVTELVVSGLFLIYSSLIIGEYFSYLAIPAMCAAASVHTVRLRIPLWIWFSITPAIAMALVLPFSAFNMSIIEGFFFFGLGCAFWKVMETQRRMQQLLDENEHQRQVLEQYAKQVETITLLEERNRLARELHDTVGHTLTSLIMGLDAVIYLLKSEPEEAAQNIRQLRTAASNGLEEVRKQIHHIAPSQEEEPLSVQLRRIAGEFAVYTGTEVDFEADGEDAAVPLPITMALVRCLQESLTNAMRHGGANHIQVTLAVQPDGLRLSVQDNGRGMEEVRYGFGLSMMRERIEAYQGELEVTSNQGGGTMISCQVPLKNRKAG